MRCQIIGQIDAVLRGEVLTAALLADSGVGGGVSSSPCLLRVRVGVGSSSSKSTCSWTAALVVGAFCFLWYGTASAADDTSFGVAGAIPPSIVLCSSL